ncbi:hypothetical protein DdX_08661 [Ditylenchus destructor]|uniref:Uncharacterized protein n=1 Tax=Ditylenchus destructor TaxID=166010 RepID=A0AAD4R727_9BILA|nr:hypothetical protein DdX_08661 [Ditylenchus destructor]
MQKKFIFVSESAFALPSLKKHYISFCNFNQPTKRVSSRVFRFSPARHPTIVCWLPCRGLGYLRMLPILRMAAAVFLNLTFSALDSFDATLNPFLDGQRGFSFSAERAETLDSLPFERGFSKKTYGTLLCGTLAVVDSLPAPLHNQSSVSAVPEKTAQLNISPAYYICLATAALCFNFFQDSAIVHPMMDSSRRRGW